MAPAAASPEPGASTVARQAPGPTSQPPTSAARDRLVKRPLLPAALAAALATALAGALTGCSARASATGPATAKRTPTSPTVAAAPRDPATAAALQRIATVFNNEYDTGDYGPVYDRWDARSKAIISRADYIRRRTECPSARTTAIVEGVTPGSGGAWLVSYEIGGVQLTDYWYYVDGRWVFDLIRSNPDAASLYRLAIKRYLTAVGCGH